LLDATALLKSHRYAGAYYLCGYVIECGLKACIAKQTRRFDFPPDRRTVQDIYTHDLELLVKVAGLSGLLSAALKANSALNTNWTIVKDWSENSRYYNATQQKAEDILDAVSDPRDGVLVWLEQYW
jgi:hypothetical protein